MVSPRPYLFAVQYLSDYNTHYASSSFLAECEAFTLWDNLGPDCHGDGLRVQHLTTALLTKYLQWLKVWHSNYDDNIKYCLQTYVIILVISHLHNRWNSSCNNSKIVRLASPDRLFCYSAFGVYRTNSLIKRSFWV